MDIIAESLLEKAACGERVVVLSNPVQQVLEEMVRRGHVIPQTTVLLSPSCPEKAEIDEFIGGLEVVYCPTATRFSLGRCQWHLAREFEASLYKSEDVI